MKNVFVMPDACQSRHSLYNCCVISHLTFHIFRRLGRKRSPYASGWADTRMALCVSVCLSIPFKPVKGQPNSTWRCLRTHQHAQPKYRTPAHRHTHTHTTRHTGVHFVIIIIIIIPCTLCSAHTHARHNLGTTYICVHDVQHECVCAQ